MPENPSAAPSVGLELTAAENAQPANDRQITVTADPKGNAQAGQAPRSTSFNVDVFSRYDLRVTGIEVTQGIQAQHTPCASNSQCAVFPSLPRLNPSNPAAAVPYQGVRLVRSKKTVARVFANATQAGGVNDVGLVLRGFRDGKELPESPLVRERDVAFGLFPHVTWTERTDRNGAETFVLPPSWTAGSLTLQAELRDPLTFLGHGAAECSEAGCQANNTFRMTGIPFVSTGYIDLATVRMWYDGEVASCAAEPPSESAARHCPPPWKALEKPARLLPLQENGYNFDPVSYYGSVDITDLKNEYTKEDRSREAKYRLDDYADDQPQGCSSRRFCADQLFGIYSPDYSRGGHSRGRLVTAGPGGFYAIDQPFAVASYVSAQTHELSHGLGRAHADTVCGGDSDGQTGEELAARQPRADGRRRLRHAQRQDQGASLARRARLQRLGCTGLPAGPLVRLHVLLRRGRCRLGHVDLGARLGEEHRPPDADRGRARARRRRRAARGDGRPARGRDGARLGDAAC